MSSDSSYSSEAGSARGPPLPQGGDGHAEQVSENSKSQGRQISGNLWGEKTDEGETHTDESALPRMHPRSSRDTVQESLPFETIEKGNRTNVTGGALDKGGMVVDPRPGPLDRKAKKRVQFGDATDKVADEDSLERARESGTDFGWVGDTQFVSGASFGDTRAEETSSQGESMQQGIDDGELKATRDEEAEGATSDTAPSKKAQVESEMNAYVFVAVGAARRWVGLGGKKKKTKTPAAEREEVSDPNDHHKPNNDEVSHDPVPTSVMHSLPLNDATDAHDEDQTSQTLPASSERSKSSNSPGGGRVRRKRGAQQVGAQTFTANHRAILRRVGFQGGSIRWQGMAPSVDVLYNPHLSLLLEVRFRTHREASAGRFVKRMFSNVLSTRDEMIDDFMAALEKEGVFARQTVEQDDARTGRAQEEAEEALSACTENDLGSDVARRDLECDTAGHNEATDSIRDGNEMLDEQEPQRNASWEAQEAREDHSSTAWERDPHHKTQEKDQETDILRLAQAPQTL